MSDTSTNLSLPYIQPSQAQKHVTHNEAVQLLDAVVQLAVIDRNLTAPPALPVDGDRYIVASGATGDWAGWDLNVVYRIGGAWLRLTPRTGWLAWVADELALLVWTGIAWAAASSSGGGGSVFSDADFELTHAADPTKVAAFNLAALPTATTRTYALPDVDTEIAGLAGTQNFTGNKTFAGTLTATNTVTASGNLTSTGAFSASGSFSVTGPAATLGSSTATATYGVGTGATAAATTKTVNLGTGAVSGSTTVINLGSATVGAGGTTVINTPTVTFANAVTTVAMPQANLTAGQLGLGGATADATNRLSVNTPAILLNNAGTSIEATVNKNAAANDAALAFKTGFSTRALIGLLANDDFSFKVSPDGSSYFDALQIDRTSGRVELPKPLVLSGQSAPPAAPAAGKLSVYGRNRAGATWVDVMRPGGREFSVQSHIGLTRVARWTPSASTTIIVEGMAQTAVGTVSTPIPAAGTLVSGIRRWRVTSAATASAAAEQRSAAFVCWRGNAAGQGGWTYVSRISLTTLQATGMAFFGLNGVTTALATTTTLATMVNAVGIGFERGTHTRWQLVSNDATGAPTLVDMGANFNIATGGLYTLYLYAAPNGASVWVRVVDDVTGAVFEQEITTDLPANTQFLTPRCFMTNAATAAAVAYDCSGVYVETDY